MGRTRKNCPVFGCGSANLSRLANHLDQVHGMEESIGTLLKRQEEMERKFNVYLQAAKLKNGHPSKPKHSKKDRNKWLTF